MAFEALHSSTFKVLGIGVLALLMLIPLVQVQGLIAERNALRQKAVNAIAQSWGGEQQLGGPVLAVPKHVRVQTNTGWTTQDSTEILLPDRLDIRTGMAPEIRRYGIYDTPVYTAEIKIAGIFLAADIKNFAATDATFEWNRAELRIPIGDVRGIRRISALHMADADYNVGPSEGHVDGISAVAVAIDPTKLAGDRWPFEIELTLAGTQSLDYLPLARHTEVATSAPWADPSFEGAFLPAEHRIDERSFDANWQVLDLNRQFGQHWQQDVEHCQNIGRSAFGVSLYQPASVYQQNKRAGKYGVLFIGLTFVAFFLFEVLRKLRVHPVQYLLAGLALTTFYVVLLAFSEQIGFAWAYLCAAGSVVLLVAGYAAAVLRTRSGGVMLGGVLALVYGLLYGLVVSEQYSLLMGSVALLGMVAALMYLTRKVDWYAAAIVRGATPSLT